MSSVGEEIQKEIARVRDVVLPEYIAIGPVGAIGAALLRQSLDRAVRALAEGDIVQIVRSYKELRDAN